MGKLKTTFLIAFLMLTTCFCFAKQISIQIVQHGAGADSVFEQAFQLEDQLLDGLFESGYIVTNSPAVISKSSSEDLNLWNMGIGDAWEGSSDYFAQINLFFDSAEMESSGNAVLNKVDLAVASVKTGKKISGSSFKTSTKLIDNKALKNLSSDVISEIYKAIRSNKA
ncbi:MAG: hypothetical protein MJ162_07360 [Treponema sp.]|nr:hypothetical protein [Treponema sp.]